MSEVLCQPSTNSILVHALWPIEKQSDSLTEAAWGRLPTYIVRYAQTLGVMIYSVGGTSNHVHILLDLPHNKTFDGITLEMQKAVARFVKEALNLSDFAWDRAASSARSIGHEEFDALRDYISENSNHHLEDTTEAEWEGEETAQIAEPDAMPAWLRAAMPPST